MSTFQKRQGTQRSGGQAGTSATSSCTLVQAPDDSWWALFLATRAGNLQGPNLLGRETFLAPVRWQAGWPVIGNAGTVELEMPAPRLPRATTSWRTGDSPWLFGWTTRQLPIDGVAIDAAARVELPVTVRTLDEDGAVSAVLLRQTEHRASFGATVEAVPDGVTAGITAYAAPEHHFDLAVHDQHVTLRRRAADLVAEHSVPLPVAGPVELTVDCDGADYTFAAHTTSETVTVGAGSARLLDASWVPGFASVRFGVYATGPGGGTVTFTGVGGEHVG